MSKKKNTEKEKTVKQTPSYYRYFYPVTCGLAFLTAFLIYLATLAPGVTFEDSGELITAAYCLGVPHEPGYPLFTMLGKFFSFLPFGQIAYRLNLMSAFFSAFAALLICRAAIILIEDTRFFSSGNKRNSLPDRLLICSAALAASLFYTLSFENWEQSVITEVYGLNSFFTACFILFILLWNRQKDTGLKEKYFYVTCLIIGLALTNHTTSLMLVPLFLFLILMADYRFLFSLRRLLLGALFGIAGLLPLVYLPLASSRNPLMDWGNPENITNFLRTIMRHQYSSGIEQSAEKFRAGLGYYFTGLLPEQWFILVPLLAAGALIILFRYNKRFFYFSLAFLLFTIPVTTYMTDFEVRGSGFAAGIDRVLVSVFYIPSYLFMSLLAGLCLYFIFSLFKRKSLYYFFIVLCLILPVVCSFGNFKKADMSRFHYTEQYVSNVFTSLTKDALVFTQVDYFYFPLIYYQFVEKKRPDIMAIDQPLLKRSWYVQMIRNNYPSLIQSSEDAVNRFLQAVQPFEDGQPYDGNHIEAQYIGMINSLIDETIKQGKEVFFTYIPPPEILRNFKLESVIGAFKLSSDGKTRQVNYSHFRLDDFKKIKDDGDLLLCLFRDYYRNLVISYALSLEKNGNLSGAKYFYTESLSFFDENSPEKASVESRIGSIKE